MKRLPWPRTLAGRLAALLVLCVVLSQLLALGWVTLGRSMLAGRLMVDHLGPELASAVAVLDRVDPAERPAWLARLARGQVRYALAAAPPSSDAPDATAQRLQQTLRALPGLQAARVMPGTAADGAMRVALALRDGTPLTVSLLPIDTAPSPALAGAMALQAVLLAAVVLLAARGTTRSLSRLAQATESLDPQHPAPAPQVQGPAEVQRLAAALAALRQRVAAHQAEHARLLAEISHDLQTPITRLRLRAELADAGPGRDKTLRDLAEMQALVEQGIAYARSRHAAAEAVCRVDLHSLVDGLVCDRVDAGDDAGLQGEGPLIVDTRPQTLLRLLANLIDNAIKFGGGAQVLLQRDAQGVSVQVLDDGPGIPAQDLQSVGQPFHRLGPGPGSGLGLAIAHELAAALGAQLELANRPGGGLAAVLRLPAGAAPGFAPQPSA